MVNKQIYENFFNIITKPNEAFREIIVQDNLRINAFIILSFLSVFNHILKYQYTFTSSNMVWFFVTLFLALIFSFINWILFCGFFAIVAKIFKNESRYEKLLTTGVYALLPLIFIAPLEILKTIFNVGYFLGVTFEIIIHFWVIILFTKMLTVIYELSFSRALALIFLPILYSFLGFIQVMDIILKISYIFR